MRWAAWLFGVRLTGVIDRIEDDVSVVEWGRGCRTDVPTFALPAAIREGDRVSVLARLAEFPPHSRRGGFPPSARVWPHGWAAAAFECLKHPEEN